MFTLMNVLPVIGFERAIFYRRGAPALGVLGFQGFAYRVKPAV